VLSLIKSSISIEVEHSLVFNYSCLSISSSSYICASSFYVSASTPSGIITSPRRDLLTHAQDATTHPDYPISEMLIQSLPHGQYALLLTHPVAVGDYRDLIRLLLSVFKLLPSFHDDSPLSRRLMYFELHNHLILLLGRESHCIKRGFAWG
jgi:hypothetical protein